MAQNKDDKDEKVAIIPRAEYRDDLETEVNFQLARINASHPFRVTKKYDRIVIPDFKPHEKRERLDWELEEIRRCIHGHDGMPGRYYYFFNHVKIKHKKKGIIRPDFRATQLFWAKTKERVMNTPGTGIVMIKRRQVGMSWDMSADNIYDAQFNHEWDLGMNSKSEADSRKLFLKHKFIHRTQSPFLRAMVHIDRRDAMVFGRWVEKQKKNVGTMSTITSVAPTPTAHAGNQYRKLVMDEAGECFSPEFKVLMADGGVKQVKDIVVGDRVMGVDSKPKEVINTTTGFDEMYEVTGRRGVRFRINSRHKLPLYHSHHGYRELTAEEYTSLPSAKQRYYQLQQVGVDFEQNKYFFDPYWLGLWLGDGDKDGPTVVTADDEIFNYLTEESPIYHNLNYSVYQNEIRGVNLTIKDGVSPVQELKKLGVFKNKRIPEVYLKTSRVDRLRLLAGLIDSDGYKDSRKDRYEIALNLKPLAENVLELTKSLGYASTLKHSRRSLKRPDGSVYNYDQYRVSIDGNNLNEIPCRLARKQVLAEATVSKGRRDPMKTGFAIRSLGRGEYAGFKLKEDSLFVGADFLVHHNCDVVAIWSNAEDTLMQDGILVCTPFIFGTMGDTDTVGQGLMEFWKNHKVYGLEQFAFWGYNCLIIDELGNDDIENSLRWIIYERKRREEGATRIYKKFLQKYPITEEDAFLSISGVGVGDPILLGRQRLHLFDNPPQAFTGYMRPRLGSGIITTSLK